MPEHQANEPAINLPSVISATIAVLIVVHVASVSLSLEWRAWAIEQFAFIPVRMALPDWGPQRVWMWLSYAFLHGDAFHLGVNALWLAIFGAPVARRIGTVRFLGLSILGAFGSALLFYAFHIGGTTPMIGYSGVVSALTGAAARFAFGPAGIARSVDRGPRLSIVQTFLNRSSLAFVAIWLVANLLSGSGMLTPDGPRVAWEAHIGGFLIGLLMFGAFDPQSGSEPSTNESDPPASTDR